MRLIDSIRTKFADRKAKKRRRQERSFHSGTGGGPAGHRPPDAPGTNVTGH